MNTEQFRISDFAEEAGYGVVRDSSFEQLGFLNHHGSGLLVPLYERNELKRLEKLGGRVAAVLTTPTIASAVGSIGGLAVADSPIEAFWRLHLAIGRSLEREQPLQPSIIGAGARVHPRAHIDERGVVIGEGTEVGPNSSIIGRVIIGKNAIISSNVAIGNEGFQVTRIEGNITNVPHLGGVWLGNHVEVQAGATIDRSLWPGYTKIGDETKIGAGAQISHCTIVGRRCRVMVKSIVCGSALIGDDAIVGVGAVVSSGITVGNGATIMISELARRDVPEGMVQFQSRLYDQRKFARMKALLG